MKRAISKAEEKFAALQKKDTQALQEKEKARQAQRDKVARLKALRLEALQLAKESSEDK